MVLTSDVEMGEEVSKVPGRWLGACVGGSCGYIGKLKLAWCGASLGTWVFGPAQCIVKFWLRLIGSACVVEFTGVMGMN